MPILLLLAGAVVLIGVVSVAMGHGGEMAEFATDHLPPAVGDVMTAADVATLRPPSALWGYNTQVTDEVLSRAAQVISERDVEIAVLRQQLAELRSATGSHPALAAAALLARSNAARRGGARAGEAHAGEPGAGGANAGGARAGQGGAEGASSPGTPVAASGPLDPGAPDADAPSWARSGEAAAGRDD